MLLKSTQPNARFKSRKIGLPPGADVYVALKPLNASEPSVLKKRVSWFIEVVNTDGMFDPQKRPMYGDVVEGPLYAAT